MIVGQLESDPTTAGIRLFENKSGEYVMSSQHVIEGRTCPVVDGDAHNLEYIPLIMDIAEELADRPTATALTALMRRRSARLRELSPDERRAAGRWRGAWWGAPAGNTLDLATVLLPRLLHERQDELGIDFQFLYPSLGLLVFLTENAELRRLMARSVNMYNARLYQDVRSRIEPAAIIPMHEPAEAIAEIEHSVSSLGYRAVVMTGVIPRRNTEARATGAHGLDVLPMNEIHDYDPVWAACDRLHVMPTFHGTGMGWGSRSSGTNYVFNHLGNFAAANEATCRAIIMGGAASRFPRLNWGFLEGGVTWACQLMADLRSHFAKRNKVAIHQYSPDAIDHDLLSRLYEQYSDGHFGARLGAFTDWAPYLLDPEDGRPLHDDFALSGIASEEDISEIFDRFFFGCEADDPFAALAFRGEMNGRATLNAFLSSDIGHWDVSDARKVVPEARSLVTSGGMTEDEFREFAFGNIVEFFSRGRSDFFQNTNIADEVGAPADL